MCELSDSCHVTNMNKLEVVVCVVMGIVVLSSAQCDGQVNCVSLGHSSVLHLEGTSSLMLAGNFGPPYPRSCREAWDQNFANENGLHGTGMFSIATNADASEAALQRCEMPPPPTSCLDALNAGFANLGGVDTGTGTYKIQPVEDSLPTEVYCDMTVEGGGWTLLGNIGGRGGWIPDLGSGSSTFNSSAEFNPQGYDSTWQSDVTYFRGIPNLGFSEVLFMTKQRSMYCVLARTELIQDTGPTLANATVVASYSTVGAVRVAGEVTQLLNDAAVPEHPLVGCAGPNGTLADNSGMLLWAERGLGPDTDAAFKNSQGGIGVFLR